LNTLFYPSNENSLLHDSFRQMLVTSVLWLLSANDYYHCHRFDKLFANSLYILFPTPLTATVVMQSSAQFTEMIAKAASCFPGLRSRSAAAGHFVRSWSSD